MYMEFIEGEKHGGYNPVLSNTHDKFRDAGYVLTEDDLVVDIDSLDKNTIKKMLDTFNIKTQTVWTERGVHLYFKKSATFRGAKKICALGFEIEFKHSKNTKAVTIKRNGILRTIENEGIRENLPEVFALNKRFESLLGMSEGDGRNNALFEHRLKLGGIPQWQTILRFINENIFDEPMTEDEFNYIVRDIKLDVEKDGECEAADYIMNKYRLVFYASNLYFYLDGEYRNDYDHLRRIIYQEVGAQKTRFVDEVLKQLEYRSPIISDKAFDIKFKNGILRAGEFYEIDYDEFTPYVIDVNYRENAEPVKEVDDYVQLLTNGDERYRDLLFEILAHTLIVDKEFKRLLAKFFIFVGDGGNGKGTLLTIIRKILNAKNCTGLSIKNMSDERYFVTMKGKLANLGDDIDDQPINNEQMKQLKNISTCDFVATRELFKQSKETELTISLIFTSNHILKSFEKGESYRRRVLWLPMYTKPTKKDPLFISKLTTEKALEYWISLIIEGYRRLYQNATFTESELVDRFNKEYHEDNNGVLLYLRDHRAEDFKNRKPKEVWQHFEIWAEENDVSSTPKMLKEAIMQNFSLKVGVKKINGVSCRVYMDM